jgi:DNA-binding helix-hairpin-helix protein with protein kinase domain
MLISIAEVRDAPVTLDIASQQISQYLMGKKNKELAAAEIQRLRSTAKIDYLNKQYAPDATTPGAVPAGAAPAAVPGAVAAAAAAAPAGAPAVELPAAQPAAPAGDAHKAALDRGVAGLK